MNNASGAAAGPSLAPGVIGNGSGAALLDERARVAWCCLPRFDADPTFCDPLSPGLGGGDWAVELEDVERFGQHDLSNTATLVMRVFDRHGGVLAATGRSARAGVLSENMPKRRDRPGVLSEDIALRSGEGWGDFPQSYSLMGLSQAARRLSRTSEGAV